MIRKIVTVKQMDCMTAIDVLVWTTLSRLSVYQELLEFKLYCMQIVFDYDSVCCVVIYNPVESTYSCWPLSPPNSLMVPAHLEASVTTTTVAYVPLSYVAYVPLSYIKLSANYRAVCMQSSADIATFPTTLFWTLP